MSKLPEAIEATANEVVVPCCALKFWSVVDDVTSKLVDVAPPESERLRPLMRPVFEMVKRVEVAKVAVDEEMLKRLVVLKVDEATKSERTAVGVVVAKPIPTFPFWKKVVVDTPPK